MGNCFVGQSLPRGNDATLSKSASEHASSTVDCTNSMLDPADDQESSHFASGTSLLPSKCGDQENGENMNHSASHDLHENLRHVPISNKGRFHSQLNKHTNAMPCYGSTDSQMWSQNKAHVFTDGFENDKDAISSFGENWDPILFDQRSQPPMKHEAYPYLPNNRPQQSSLRRRISGGRRKTRFAAFHWPSNNSIAEYPPRYRGLSLISSAILGFSQLQPSSLSKLEWYRNGELESAVPQLDEFLIKGKQKTRNIQTEMNDNNGDEDLCSQNGQSKQDDETSREGWLRYTMFLQQQKSDAMEFYRMFRKAKHIFMSLETRTGCEVRLSKRLFVHKGKYVRTVVIDGPSRRHILRCYSSLPKLFTDLVILDCERPSISESRPHIAHCHQEERLSTSRLLPIVA